MIIHDLVKAYDRLAKNPDCQITRNGFCFDVISYFVVIDNAGNLLDIIKNSSVSPERVPENLKKNATEAWYLIDSIDYLLGLDLDKSTGLWCEALDKKNIAKKAKGQAYSNKFEVFRTKNLDFLQGINSEIAAAIVNFLSNWQPADNTDNEALYLSLESSDKKPKKISGNCTFVLDSVVNKSYADEEILKAWSQLLENSVLDDEYIGQCLVSGEMKVIAKNHKPIKLSNQRVKVAHLISLNKGTPAFQSYGKKECYNCPISKEVMNKYTSALTYFYRKGSKNNFRLGNDTVIFWAESDCDYEEAFLSMLDAIATKDKADVTEDEIRASLKQFGKGLGSDEISDDVRFHLMIVSPNTARLSVKRYLNTTFGDIKKNIEMHEKDLSIFDSSGKIPKASMRNILDATVSSVFSNNRDSCINPNFDGALFDSIFNGTQYSASIFSEMIARLKTDNSGADDAKRAGMLIYLTRSRIAYIKAYLVRKARFENKKEDIKMALNHECREEAYLLGRLFAVMEKVQKEAIKGINTTIKDRFFASAASTPSAVFSSLLAGYGNNISKLEGSGVRYEKIVSEIFNLLETDKFSKQLNIEQQGSFMIGYYQQNADFYTKKETDN